MNTDHKIALVLGASGLVGSALLELLLANNAYARVVVFTRRHLDFANVKLTQHIIDFDKPESWAHLVKGDALFCCLGTTIKVAGSREAFRRVDYEYPVEFARIAAKNGVAQFLLVSSVGADAKSSVFYLRTKGECENNVRDSGVKSVSIFRPASLTGNRKEFRLGEKISVPLLKLFSFALQGKSRKYRPVKATQVAAAMMFVSQKTKRETETETNFAVYESDEIAKM